LNLARLTAFAAAFSVPAAILISYATLWVDSTPRGLIGATWYGYPVAWAFRGILAPIYNPWSYDYFAFAEDVFFWFAVSFFILYLGAWVVALAVESRAETERAT
jgi:hypothetical protein